MEEDEKRPYVAPAVELVTLGADDVIVASGPDQCPNELPIVPVA